MSLTLEDLCTIIKKGNEDLKQEISNVRKDLCSEIRKLEQKNDKLEVENKRLKEKLTELERKAKKYNLILYGLDGDEAGAATTGKILDLVNNTLGIPCARSDLRDSYRIGKTVDGNIRPIVVEVVNLQFKSEILNRAKVCSSELREKRVNIALDYTKEDYEERKCLLKHMKAAKEKQYSARIKNNILIVNGEEFSYDYLKNKEDQQMDDSSKVISYSAPPTPTLVPFELLCHSF
ncbi:unnamed protein product [Phaedon cochleariae]|uniref:Endonuclease-reverse transcriptase n=1 Tax=Phaedon cochleariae TaxID=80249 RepID=A0A9N9WXW5_PHACE|nr:unnamed protein product [Phaedon cochleariae]